MAAYLAATPGRGKAFVYDVVDDDGDDAEIRHQETPHLSTPGRAKGRLYKKSPHGRRPRLLSGSRTNAARPPANLRRW